MPGHVNDFLLCYSVRAVFFKQNHQVVDRVKRDVVKCYFLTVPADGNMGFMLVVDHLGVESVRMLFRRRTFEVEVNIFIAFVKLFVDLLLVLH